MNHDPNCLEEVSKIYESGAEPHLESMQDALGILLRQTPKRLIIVDGVDECHKEDRAAICKSLMSLPAQANVIVFSRDLEDLKKGLMESQGSRNVSRLEIKADDTRTDIMNFTSRELAKLPELDDDAQQRLSLPLQNRAQGMFLWVDLMIKHLSNGWIDTDDYVAAIEDMPQDLDEVYSRIMRSVSSEFAVGFAEERRSKVIFQWLVCAQRPLTLLEISVASKTLTDEPRLRQSITFGAEQLGKYIRRLTGQIVRISGASLDATVSLIHATAKDFLLRCDQPAQPFAELLVNARTANTFIARSCIIYLCYENVEFCPFEIHMETDGRVGDTWSTLDSKFERYCKRYPLLRYAVLHWPDHFGSSDGNDDLCRILSRLCTSEANTIRWLQVYLRTRGDRGHFRSSPGLKDLRRFESCNALIIGDSSWYSSWLSHIRGPPHGRFERWERFMGSGNANDFLPPLHVAAFFDFHDFVEQQLLGGADANQRSIDLQTPLHLAARGDAVDSGRILIHHGADLNPWGWEGNAPLGWAIDVECNTTWTKSGPFEMAHVLLNAGADPTLYQNHYPPLHRACDMPIPDDPYILEVVHSLLQHGADRFINGHPDSHPPLANAAATGGPALVKALLDAGADPNGGLEVTARQRSYRYPLLAAVQRASNPDVIRLLLEAGADVNCRGPDGRTALHLCMKKTQELVGIVELLLSHGADVDAQAIDGSLPLHDAVAENKLNAMGVLIGAGCSLNVEEVTGLTPLVLAAENGWNEAAECLVEAGALMAGPDWQLSPAQDGGFEVSRRADCEYWPQTAHDIFEVHWMLGSHHPASSNAPLTRPAVVKILNMAGYWLRSRCSRAELEEYNQERAALHLPYILSEPIQGRAHGAVREVTIVTRSHDQGWSDYPEHHGTYYQSSSWFEVAIQKSDGRWVEWGEERKIIYNVHASDRTRQHCVVFGRHHPKTQCKWITWLGDGDRVGVVPKAAFLGWVNFVESVSIEIVSSFVD